MADYSWEARFSLIIAGNDLPLEELEQKLDLKPTRLLKAGELLNRLPEVRSKTDQWRYSIQLTSPKEEDKDLNALLLHLMERKSDLDSIRSRYDVVIRLFIRSEKATFTYSLMPETLDHLQKLGLSLDVTSLSWGEIGI